MTAILLTTLLKNVLPILAVLVVVRLCKPGTAQWMVESIITKLLLFVHPVRDDQGNQIPGPNWQWLNGQTLDKFLDGRGKAQEWQKFGQIYRIWACSNPEIVITKPEDVRAFHTDSSFHNKAQSSNAGWLFHQLLGECMGLINGTRWNKVRSEFGPAFIHSAVVQKALDISKDAKRFIGNFGTSPVLTMHAASTVSRFPFFCTASHLYGELSCEEQLELWELGQRNLQMMGHILSGGLFRFPIARYFHRSAAHRLASFSHDWTQFNRRIYHKRLNNGFQPPIVSIWQKVIDGTLTEEEVVHTLSEILFANLDVSTGNLSWLVIYLAKYKDIQNQLVQELKQNEKDLDSYCSRKDTLLAYSVLETLRLRPFTVFSIPESSPKDKVLQNFRVPRNTSVVVNTLAINYNREFWGEKNEIFDPNRFRSIKNLELRYNLFAFGMGSRKCLGSHFAEMMMKYFVIHLLDLYSLDIPVGKKAKKEDTSMDTWVPIPDMEIILRRRPFSLFQSQMG
ncbi:cytochrome P450 monooxygenase, partial [Metarhizium hybridum]